MKYFVEPGIGPGCKADCPGQLAGTSGELGQL